MAPGIRSDRDGGYVLSKGAMVFFTFVLLCASVLAGAVTQSVTAGNKINYLKDVLDNHLYTHERINVKLEECATVNVELSTKIDGMEDDISEIKADVKELLKSQGGG